MRVKLFALALTNKNSLNLFARKAASAKLFLTPSSDKWLGVFPEESYTGIENDGIRR